MQIELIDGEEERLIGLYYKRLILTCVCFVSSLPFFTNMMKLTVKSGIFFYINLSLIKMNRSSLAGQFFGHEANIQSVLDAVRTEEVFRNKKKKNLGKQSIIMIMWRIKELDEPESDKDGDLLIYCELSVAFEGASPG